MHYGYVTGGEEQEQSAHVSRRPPRSRTAALRLVALVALVAALLGVAVPASPASAAPSTSGGFTTSASVTPGSVVSGAGVRLGVTVTAASTRNALVDVEVFDSAGRKLFQRYWDNRSLTAGVARTFNATWAVPATQAAGSYRVDVGIFSPGWSELYHWNYLATTLTVTAGTPPTATTAPPTTAPPTTQPPPTTTTSTTTTTTAPPVTTPPPTGRFVTLPPGSPLPSDAECAARVRPAAEVRARNEPYNRTRGISGMSNDHLFSRVTGNYTGTTDEIIQWAACKWGFDEDVVRAQSVIESWWDQRTHGDLTSDPGSCPPGRPIGYDGHPGQCVDSWGLQQIRHTTFRWAFPSFEVAPAISSTAWNVDLALGGPAALLRGGRDVAQPVRARS